MSRKPTEPSPTKHPNDEDMAFLIGMFVGLFMAVLILTFYSIFK